MVLKISKLVLTSLANYIVISSQARADTDGRTERSALLQQALAQIPSPTADCVIRDVSQKVAAALYARITPEVHAKLLRAIPDKSRLQALQMIAWTSATGRTEALQATVAEVRKLIAEEEEPSTLLPLPAAWTEIYGTCKESLEVMAVMFMLSPNLLEGFMTDSDFKDFVIDLILISPSKYVY